MRDPKHHVGRSGVGTMVVDLGASSGVGTTVVALGAPLIFPRSSMSISVSPVFGFIHLLHLSEDSSETFIPLQVTATSVMSGLLIVILSV